MTEFTGINFDGRTLHGSAVRVTLTDTGELQLETDAGTQRVALAAVTISDRIGSVPRFLYLPDGSTIETADHAAIDHALARERRGRLTAAIHLLESHTRVATGATLALVALVAACLQFGLPRLAAHTARKVPAAIETKAGEVALTTLQPYLGASMLGRHERNRVQRQLDRLIEVRPLTPRPQLVFCQMGGMANAFALPGNSVVVSDAFVRLATDDDEIAAVLAHELGHLEHRHGLQSLLRSSMALLVVASVTGDLSSLTAFSGTVPFILLQNGYSRDLERAADAHAFELMHASGIRSGHFTAILEKLEAARPDAGVDYTYLSTHPNSRERASRFGPPIRSAAAAVVPDPVARETSSRSVVKLQRVLFPDYPLPESIREERKVYLMAALDQEALTEQQVEPVYPIALEAEGVDGEVVVDFVVDMAGDVRSIHVVSATHPDFAEAVTKAAYLWKFKPARTGGQLANARAAYQVTFTAESE